MCEYDASIEFLRIPDQFSMERRIHIRLCHKCNKINEAENQDVLKCETCGKAFLPVDYFKKIRAKAIESGMMRPEAQEIILNPLQGLIAFW